MKALKLKNLPTPKDEAWKYTNLPKAIPDDLAPAESEEQVVHIPRGQIGEEPRDILFVSEDKTLQTPRLKIVLEEGAELTIMERHSGEGAYWRNMICKIELGANAKLNHYRLLQDSRDSVLTIQTHITQDADSLYNNFALMQGAKLTRNEFQVEIKDKNAECELNGINLLNGEQHGDTTILVEHQAPHCRSHQFFRSILDDQSRGVFQGKVHVHQIAQKTDGYQMSNALLLSPQAEMDTKPELEIYADDVLCSHGSTTGQLDEGPLFYLRSRGLNEAEARLLLATAFIDEVTAHINDENFRFEVERHAHEWLQKALAK